MSYCKKCTPFCLLISYHSRTSLAPIHRFRLVLAFMVVTAVLIDFCVTLPRLFRAGLISLHWMLFGKFSLWSLIDMKAFLSVIFFHLSFNFQVQCLLFAFPVDGVRKVFVGLVVFFGDVFVKELHVIVLFHGVHVSCLVCLYIYFTIII